MSEKFCKAASVGTAKRALFVIDSLESSHGTEMLTVILAGELVKLGWKLDFFAAEYTPATSPWTTVLQRLGIKVHRPHLRFLRRHLLPHRLVVSKLWRTAAHARPTLVWSPTNAILTSLALQARPKHSAPFFVHDPSEASPACPHYESLWFEVCNRVSALSVHGERQRRSAISYYGMTRPVEVVKPASLPPVYVTALAMTGKRVRFGQFGRLATMKGTLFAVAALADCVARGGDAELHFHGDGALRAQTEELTASLGLKDRVFFHGTYLSHELDHLVSKIDVGIMPSTYEGFGLVMLEILSRGRPIIATDVGSSQELLGDSGPGWVVPRANTTALADAMLACCNDPARTMEKARGAQQFWENQFTPEKMSARYLEFWSHHGVEPTICHTAEKASGF